MNGRTMTRVASRRGPARGVVALGAALALSAGACDMTDDPTMGSSEEELTFGTVLTTNTATALQELYAEFEWAMEPRAFAALGAYTPNGDWKEQYDEDYLYPDAYYVGFNACDSVAIGTNIVEYKWRFEGNGLDVTLTSDDCHLPARGAGPRVRLSDCPEMDAPQCDVDLEGTPTIEPLVGAPAFPSTGNYAVTLTVKAANGTTNTLQEVITLRDLLVLSVGDSMASGEGAPHVPADNPELAAVLGFVSDKIQEQSVLAQTLTYGALLLSGPIGGAIQIGLLVGEFFGSDEADWWDEPCHRSIFSGPGWAAALFDAAHPHLSVTFMSHACSGGKTKHLYQTAQKSGRQTQLAAAKRNLCRGSTGCNQGARRPVDVVLMSIGINDIDFSGMIIEGALPTSTSFGMPDFAAVEQGHNQIAAALADFGNPEVFIAEYPIFALKNGSSYGGCGALAGISHDEAVDLTVLGLYLNSSVEASAEVNDWNLVDGIASKFNGRGYCTSNGVESWMRKVDESFNQQADPYGAMHPNLRGYYEQGILYASKMHQVLAPFAPPEHIPDWPVRRAGGTGEDWVRAVGQADNGDIVAGGVFRNTLFIEGQAISSGGGQDGFIVRLDASGNLLWTNSVTGSGDARIYDVEVAPNGDAIVAGAFTGYMKIDTFGRTSTAWDGFVARFDAHTGSLLWARTYDGNGDQWPIGVGVDGAGRVTVTGYFKTQVATKTQNGDPLVRPAVNSSKNNCFVGWIDSNGGHAELTVFGGTGHCEARDVEMTRSGAAVVTGRFSGTLTADAGTGKKLKSDGGYDSFVSRFSPMAQFEWSAYIGGVNYYDSTNVGDAATWSVAVDADEHIYVAGQFYKYNWVQAPGNSSYLFGNANTWDGVVIELGPDGTIEHAKTFGGSGQEYIYGVTATWDGSYAVTGKFTSTDMKIDGYSVCRVGTTGMLVASFDPDGDLRWARNYGQSGTTIGYGIAAGVDGTIVAGGEFVNKLKVDDGTFIQSQGSKDGFVTRVKPGVVPTILPGLCLTTPGEISM